MTIHTGIAGLIAQPQFALDETEAKQYAAAVKQFQEAFPVTRISPQTAAALNLGTVAFAIYAPRLAALKLLRDIKRMEQRAATPTPAAAPSMSAPSVLNGDFNIPPPQPFK